MLPQAVTQGATRLCLMSCLGSALARLKYCNHVLFVLRLGLKRGARVHYYPQVEYPSYGFVSRQRPLCTAEISQPRIGDPWSPLATSAFA